jgi:hypothetical protein
MLRKRQTALTLPPRQETTWPAIKTILASRSTFSRSWPTIAVCARSDCRKELKISGLIYRSNKHPPPGFLVACGHMYCGKHVPTKCESGGCNTELGCRVCLEVETCTLPSGWESRCHLRSVTSSTLETGDDIGICIHCVQMRNTILMDMRARGLEEDEERAEQGVAYMLQQTKRLRVALHEAQTFARTQIVERLQDNRSLDMSDELSVVLSDSEQ